MTIDKQKLYELINVLESGFRLSYEDDDGEYTDFYFVNDKTQNQKRITLKND